MSLVVYFAAFVFGATSVLLFRRPRTAVRHPLTLSTCAAVLLGALVFVCAAPATLATVNDLTGVPNFGAPLTYGMLSAYSCAVLVLLINWRGGPRRRVRRLVLRTMAAYGLLVAAIVVLFALADARTERLTDLDTYYAATPFMREMILLYLLGHSAAMLVMCAVCVKWGREVGGLLRAGLRLILLGALLDVLGFQLTKYTAVVARWYGHDLDFLSTDVAPPMASLAAVLCSAGFVLPRLLPPCSRSGGAGRPPAAGAPVVPGEAGVHRARAAGRLVAAAAGAAAVARGVHPRRPAHAGPVLRPPGPRAGAGHRPERGPHPHEARLAAEAAMLADAARRAVAREEPPRSTGSYRLHATEVPGPGGLVELARALDRPVAGDAASNGPVPPRPAGPVTGPEESHVA
ncbi:MAB_1171c family putative transporter [Streptomyces sp. UC1A3]